jgi:hypothetical protein
MSSSVASSTRSRTRAPDGDQSIHATPVFSGSADRSTPTVITGPAYGGRDGFIYAFGTPHDCFGDAHAARVPEPQPLDMVCQRNVATGHLIRSRKQPPATNCWLSMAGSHLRVWVRGSAWLSVAVDVGMDVDQETRRSRVLIGCMPARQTSDSWSSLALGHRHLHAVVRSQPKERARSRLALTVVALVASTHAIAFGAGSFTVLFAGMSVGAARGLLLAATADRLAVPGGARRNPLFGWWASLVHY